MPIESIVNTLSKSRLSTYKNSNLNDTSDEQSLGLYLWNKQLSGHFFPILQIIEVSLRNAIHNAYIAVKFEEIEFNNPENEWHALKSQANLWLTTIYTIQNNQKGFNQIENAKRNLIEEGKSLTADNLIAKLTFGFWVNMTNRNHRSNNNNNTAQSIDALWPKLTKKVFPNAKDKYGKHLTINNINENLHKINKLRNRIAHHEPIWKADELFDTADAINNIVNHYDRCLKAISWLNPDNLKLISIIENDKLMSDVCSPHTLWRNKQLPTGLDTIPETGQWSQTHTLNTRRAGTVIHVTKIMALIKCDKSTITFYTNQKMLKNKKTQWPLTLNEKVNFIPKPSKSRHPHATQVLKVKTISRT